MNQEKILKFIKKNDMLKISALERQAGLPSNSLHKALNGNYSFKQEYVERLADVLSKFGLEDESDAKIISIINNKGGVGKTTTACNLGKALELRGKKVLLVDLDPQGNLSQYLGCTNPQPEFVDLVLGKTDDWEKILHKHSENLHLLPSTINLDAATLELQKQTIGGYKRIKNVIGPIAENYDFVLIDCPPSLSILTAGSLVASTDIIIPLDAEPFSMNGISNMFNLINDVRDLNPNIQILGFLFTSIKPKTVLHRDFMKSLRDQVTNYNVFDTFIHDSIAIAESTGAQKDIFDYAPDSKGADDYLNLAIEILD
ncbi:ParA family protein [Flammeovirga pectinis]|uniref:ParA family protein n=2 Tax=Flammeovirga pectinis TaxID=2494373 RepID=A0A3S9P9K9_9BACT|nr:ParA family protein [Flammeovirga pectinis]